MVSNKLWEISFTTAMELSSDLYVIRSPKEPSEILALKLLSEILNSGAIYIYDIKEVTDKQLCYFLGEIHFFDLKG